MGKEIDLFAQQYVDWMLDCTGMVVGRQLNLINSLRAYALHFSDLIFEYLYVCLWGDEKMADENIMSCHATTVCKPELL